MVGMSAIDEARLALTARLTAWSVLNPQARAERFITDLIEQGWRAPADQPPAPGLRPTDPAPAGRKADLIAESRQAIRDNPPPPPSDTGWRPTTVIRGITDSKGRKR